MCKKYIKMYKLFSFILIGLITLSACNTNQSNNKQAENPSSGIEELPGNSIYQINETFTDQNGDSLQLIHFAGKPVVFSMIFTHCEYACPMLVNDLKKVEALFSAEDREKFNFVLLSFDHIRDTSERLKEYADAQELSKNWTLLHGNEEQVKLVSMAGDISYEFVEDGGIAHANRKIILDKQGVIVNSINGLGTDPDLVKLALEKLF